MPISPVFSIVVPVYNKAPHVTRMVNSILSQTETSWECVIIDDASSDQSINIIRTLVERDERFKFHHRETPGRGGYAARNLGARFSSGEWIAFLDADDEWLPTHLSDLRALSIRFPESGFACNARLEVWPDGTRKHDGFHRDRSNLSPRSFSFPEYVAVSYKEKSPVQTSSVAVKRNIFLESGGFPEQLQGRGGDRDTWLRLVYLTPLSWTPVVSSIYYRDAVNMVTKTVAFDWAQCMDPTIEKYLSDETTLAKFSDTKLNYHLKRLWNHDRKDTCKRKLREGDFSLKDLKWFYFCVEPGFVTFVVLLGVIPNKLRVALYRCLRDMKKKLK